jgi:hypothetical protein
MSPTAQEPAKPSNIITAGQGQLGADQAQPEFSEKYSKGELEGVGSRELLDGHVE